MVAWLVPDFGAFLSLVGSSICTVLGFILPCWFHWKVMGNELPNWQVGLDLFLMVGGGVFGVLGTYQSITSLGGGGQ
jgi:proton-coupled amino acid transporter